MYKENRTHGFFRTKIEPAVFLKTKSNQTWKIHSAHPYTIHCTVVASAACYLYLMLAVCEVKWKINYIVDISISGQRWSQAICPAYGYLPSCRASPPFDQQIILLGDRGTCVWTTCPETLCESERTGIKPVTMSFWWQIRCRNHYVTMPHCVRGFHASRKVMEFKKGMFHAWKVMEFHQ